MVVWLAVGVVVLLSLVALGAALAVLRRRLAELNRVVVLVRERLTVAAGPLQTSVDRLQGPLADLNRRSALVQDRLLLLKARTRAPRQPAGSGVADGGDPLQQATDPRR